MNEKEHQRLEDERAQGRGIKRFRKSGEEELQETSNREKEEKATAMAEKR